MDFPTKSLQNTLTVSFVKNITDDTRRLVCFLYMNGYKDGAIRRILKIDKQRLRQIKTQLAFDLIKAGIRNSE